MEGPEGSQSLGSPCIGSQWLYRYLRTLKEQQTSEIDSLEPILWLKSKEQQLLATADTMAQQFENPNVSASTVLSLYDHRSAFADRRQEAELLMFGPKSSERESPRSPTVSGHARSSTFSKSFSQMLLHRSSTASSSKSDRSSLTSQLGHQLQLINGTLTGVPNLGEALTLAACLEHPPFRERLYKYLLSQFCGESLEFLDAVDVYDAIEQRYLSASAQEPQVDHEIADLLSEMARCAETICNEFIKQDSEKQINIDSNTREQVENKVSLLAKNEYQPDIFRAAAFAIYKMSVSSNICRCNLIGLFVRFKAG